MNFKSFYRAIKVSDRDEFATRCGVSQGFMDLIATGHRAPSPELAVAVERESGGVVTRPDLRPDDWHRIWPELHATYSHLMPAKPSKRKATA